MRDDGVAFCYDSPLPAPCGSRSSILGGRNGRRAGFNPTSRVFRKALLVSVSHSDALCHCVPQTLKGLLCGKQLGTGEDTWSYTAPNITSLDPGNGPVLGGTDLTISGFGFGHADYNVTGQLGSCARPFIPIVLCRRLLYPEARIIVTHACR